MSGVNDRFFFGKGTQGLVVVEERGWERAVSVEVTRAAISYKHHSQPLRSSTQRRDNAVQPAICLAVLNGYGKISLLDTLSVK